MKKIPKKMGRPLVFIDWPLAEKLAHIHCTGEEIAATLGINYDTLQERCKRDNKLTFPEWYKKNSEGGKASLRRMMWKGATAGNTTMQIWLSKQYLNMKENSGNPEEFQRAFKLAYNLKDND